MKIQKLSLLAATALASLVATTSIAQTNTNLVTARIKVTCVTTNANGQLVYTRNNTTEFIQDFASGLGITTNLTNFSLVLNFTNSSLQVVSGTNQTLVGTSLTFTNGVFLINSNHTVVELQSYIRVGTNAATTGVLTATERFTFGTSNQLTSFSLIGRFSYVEPVVGTNPPSICRGILLVGNVPPKHDFDNDDNEDNGGNNGHHGEGNNGVGRGNGGPNGSFYERHGLPSVNVNSNNNPSNNGNNGNGNNGNHGNGNNGNNGNGNNGNRGNGHGH